MSFFLLILCLEIAFHISFFKRESFNTNYLSKENIKPIKGIFVILIIFSHFVQYVTLGSVWDVPYLRLRSHLDQMVVVPFLFYSGFGIMKQIQSRGNSYVKQIMLKRFPKVWFDFFAAVLCFLIVNIVLGIKYSFRQVLLSFVGWTSIGNSNWYILGILILYILSFVAFILVRKVKESMQREILGNIILTILIAVVIYVFKCIGRPAYYYNTLIIYSLGCWFALFESKYRSFFMKSSILYFIGVIVLLCMYCLAYIKRFDFSIVSYTIWAVLFTILLIMITMKVEIKSKILNWFGDHVFSVYILQRIPMIILDNLGILKKHEYVFLIISIIFTVVLVSVFESVMEKIRGLFAVI